MTYSTTVNKIASQHKYIQNCFSTNDHLYKYKLKEAQLSSFLNENTEIKVLLYSEKLSATNGGDILNKMQSLSSNIRTKC